MKNQKIDNLNAKNLLSTFFSDNFCTKVLGSANDCGINQQNLLFHCQ